MKHLVSGRDLVEYLVSAIRGAGTAIMAVRDEGFVVHRKSDASPVTLADERAEAVIVDALRDVAPGVPIVAEEAVSRGEMVVSDVRFWLVDPLDGTREFISGSGEFTVNVALIEHGQPVLGVVYAPALGRLYGGVVEEENRGQTLISRGEAFVEDEYGRRAIHVGAVSPEGLTAVASRSHGDAARLAEFLAEHDVAECISAGSSLKFCLVAEGRADVYPRFGRTMEWDTAAGQAVLTAAGGCVVDLDGRPLRYGKPGFENPGFVAWGRCRSG